MYTKFKVRLVSNSIPETVLEVTLNSSPVAREGALRLLDTPEEGQETWIPLGNLKSITIEQVGEDE
jgi:hypothetical protein